MSSEKPFLDIDDYIKQRGDITPEMMEWARQRTEGYIRDYELKQARKQCKLTQVALAAKMKISQKRVSEIENGKIERLKVGTLQRYAEALGGKLNISFELPDKTISMLG